MRRLRLVVGLIAFAPALAATAPARAAKPAKAAPATASSVAPPKLDVKSWTLPNGLQVLFLADHKAPIATVQIFYHVGSKDEHVGIRGVAHMFEHLMFKGSAHVPPEEHARLLKEVGGQVNAFTTEDLTGFHDTVPPSYVGFALELEAERMRNLKLFPATIDSERKVVEEEKRLRVDNDPVGKAIEKFRALAYTKHPYNWTAIGTIEDLEKVTPADCQRFYDTYYQPNNATLIVVGDVDEQTVRKQIEQHFGPIPRAPDPPRNKAAEPPQTATRAETMKIEVQIPIVVGGYHIPRASDPDMPALEVLAAILSSGESSRLPERLVRHDHLAIAAGGVTEAMEDPGLFIVYAASLPSKDQTQIWNELAEEVGRVRDKPVAAAELDKAKNQLAAAFVFGLETVDGVAMRLGEAQYVEDDWHRFIEGATRYLAVTAADVQRVAQKYLVDANLTRVTLVPAGGKP
ncbi:MAG TPA: pitrilysin family protein [Polyangia bacterium]|nr:pitrilysin family protein [Polyangia bacterium]